MPEIIGGVLKFDISFKIDLIKLILYAGEDFDFDKGFIVERKLSSNGFDQSLVRSDSLIEHTKNS